MIVLIMFGLLLMYAIFIHMYAVFIFIHNNVRPQCKLLLTGVRINTLLVNQLCALIH